MMVVISRLIFDRNNPDLIGVLEYFLKGINMKNIVVSLLAFGLTASAYGKVCELTIEGNDRMQFDKKELTIDSSCKQVKLTLKHTGKLPKAAMGHNWLLVKDSDFQGAVKAATMAGAKANYVPKGDKTVLAATSLVGGGESTSVTFDVSKLDKKSSYTYFCSFPGHYSIMKGKFIIK